MKRLKKFVTLFTLAAVCFAIPGLGKITVKGCGAHHLCSELF